MKRQSKKPGNPAVRIKCSHIELEDALNQTEAFISLLMDYIVRFDSGESHIFKGSAAAGLMHLEWATVERLKKAHAASHAELCSLRGIQKGGK